MKQRTVIYRSSAARASTAQTERDNAELLARMKRAAASYRTVERFLECKVGPRLTREKLFALADRLYAQQIVDDPPDRLCRRKKEALICWFCERFAQVLGRLDPPAPAPPERRQSDAAPAVVLPEEPAWFDSTPWEDPFADESWTE
jgi:hypothetical protein